MMMSSIDWHQTHVLEDILSGNYTHALSIQRVDNQQVSQVKITEYVEYFLQLVMGEHAVRVFDHVGAQIYSCFGVFLTNMLDFIVFSVNRKEWCVKCFPVQQVSFVRNFIIVSINGKQINSLLFHFFSLFSYLNLAFRVRQLHHLSLSFKLTFNLAGFARVLIVLNRVSIERLSSFRWL